MALRFPMPLEGKITQREDDLPSSDRTAQNRLNRPMTLDETSAPTEPTLQTANGDAVPASAIARRRVVFPDPVAFRYLEEDPCVSVVERRGVLRGYELYLVEQWACSRQSPTLVVVTYTGDQRHSVVVGVLGVPADEQLWSPRLRLYFKATHQYHARPKDTNLGELMVTNLSSFPSALTVIPVPDGDIKQHRQAFFVNEDLKRLGCSGRSGMTLTDPAEATQAKFLQLYKISERISFSQAVTELIKLCQVALYMFEKLGHEYIDGLLCDLTERAVSNWWTEVGAEHYNYEPTDGILGPTTVAALLGMLMGARNRLQWYGAPMSKDVFDIESTKRGVAYFQKSQKLEKTRRLDRQTLFRLHTVTAKAAAGEGWGVQKAVKSTMTEIGGKRGEMVMGMVSGKDKGGLADIETLDLDRFVNLVYGARPKWLWLGKPRRTPVEQQDNEQDVNNTTFTKDDPSMTAAKRVQSLPVEDEVESRHREDPFGPSPSALSGTATNTQDSPHDRDALRKSTMLRNVAGKVNDARGRLKDAVGGNRRGHTSRPSVSGNYESTENGSPITALNTSVGSMTSTPSVARAFTWKNKPEEYLAAMGRSDVDILRGLPDDSRERLSSTPGVRKELESSSSHQVPERQPSTEKIGAEVRQGVLSEAPSAVQSVADESDLQGPMLEAELTDHTKQHVFSRRHSFDAAVLSAATAPSEDRWPRRMSFGDAEEAVLTWEDVIEAEDAVGELQGVEALPEVAFHLHRSIERIMREMEPWVNNKLGAVELLNERFGRDRDDIQQLYQQLKQAYHGVRTSSDELLAEERANLTESVKEIEVLAQRLDYEINSLVQRVHDVEDGVANFERQVEDVEKRAEDLKVQLETEGWLHWLVRTLTGVGTGSNITRAK